MTVIQQKDATSKNWVMTDDKLQDSSFSKQVLVWFANPTKYASELNKETSGAPWVSLARKRST